MAKKHHKPELTIDSGPDPDSRLDPDSGDAIQALEPNAPEKLPGFGRTGTRQAITKVESQKRHATMDKLIISGLSDSEMEMVMQKKFAMEPTATKRLFYSRLHSLAQEDLERKPYHRVMASRRLYDHIRGAVQAERWGDVANLEKTLADIQGTKVDPTEQASPVEQRFTEATMRMLNESNPKEVLAIIEYGKIAVLKGVNRKEDDDEQVIDVEVEQECNTPSAKSDTTD